jgi:hypothetical protein
MNERTIRAKIMKIAVSNRWVVGHALAGLLRPLARPKSRAGPPGRRAPPAQRTASLQSNVKNFWIEQLHCT